MAIMYCSSKVGGTLTKTQIEACRKLGMTEAEIADIAVADTAINRGEKLFELTAEQEKVAKQARRADRKPTVYKFDKKPRKVNEAKVKLIEMFAATAKRISENVEIVNAEREFTFIVNGIKYKMTMSVPRK